MASQDRRGLQIPDKSFIPYHVFRYGLGCVKLCSISELPCSLFSAPKDYFLGLDLVVAAAAREGNEGPKPTSSLPPPRAWERSSEVGRRQGLLPGKNVCLER